MKFLTVFAAVLAVAFGSHSHWTLDQLSSALENPTTNPSLVPALEQALNTFMASIFAGESHQYISITTAPVDLSTWTLNELSEAIENPNTSPALMPYFENALNTLMNAVVTGEVQPATAQVAITVPGLELSYWTLADVDQALMDPTTNPALIPYLEQALNKMMENLFNGVEGASSIVLAIPLDVATAPVVPEVVSGVEVSPVQVVDTPALPPVGPAIVAPVEPAPASPAPAVSSSPLVQIIVNVNQKESEAVVVPAPVAVPENPSPFPDPRPPAPESPIHPDPVIIPTPVIIPEPVVLPSPPTPEVIVPEVINPDPVIVVPDFNPIDEIMITPPEINPIDAISPIVISPPEVNPVDILHPLPITPVVVAGGDIGPM